MLTQQRANTVCASCHSRDPMGFARENYFIGSRGIRMQASRSTTAANCRTGRVPAGPQRLKAALLERKDLFVSNVTAKMLGYALGRGLTPQDSCAADGMVAELKENDYRAQKLVVLIASIWSDDDSTQESPTSARSTRLDQCPARLDRKRGDCPRRVDAVKSTLSRALAQANGTRQAPSAFNASAAAE